MLHPAISCYEVDADGNQYLMRSIFKVQSNNKSSTPDKNLVKDVTDALRNKVGYL